MPAAKWRANRDLLWRGDSGIGVACPHPGANPSIVRHVLYLDGPGRETPYSSTTESRQTAEVFAGNDGREWSTTVGVAKSEGVEHIDRRELLRLLRGHGQGDANWPNPYEVLQARRYVELWQEHLLDFRPLRDQPPAEVAGTVQRVFQRGTR